MKRTLLKRGTKQLKRSGMKKKPSKHNWEEMTEAIYGRSGGLCEVCKVIQISKENVRRENIHHILPRSQGGSDAGDNLAFVCGPMNFYGGKDFSCHTAIHSYPKAAREEGWLK